MAMFSGCTPLVLDHTLNQVKQSNQIIADIGKTAVSFEPNTSGSNVNIDCNPGFYHLIVRPSFCNLQRGYQFTHLSTSFVLTDFTPHLDHTSTEEGRLLQFTFHNRGGEQSLSVHLHHTTRRVQVQGAAVMPDHNTAAVYFVNHFLTESFKSLAQTNHQRIDDFHKGLLDLVPDQPSSLPTRNRKSASLRGRPVGTGGDYCFICWFHLYHNYHNHYHITSTTHHHHSPLDDHTCQFCSFPCS